MEPKIILTEENVIDVIKKLINDETVSEEVSEQIKKRFFELVNYPS